MIEREQIISKAKKLGLVRSGNDFVDESSGAHINLALLISCVRRLSQSMSLEETVKKCVATERDRLAGFYI